MKFCIIFNQMEKNEFNEKNNISSLFYYDRGQS